MESNLKKYYKIFLNDDLDDDQVNDGIITFDNLSVAEEVKEMLQQISLHVERYYEYLYKDFSKDNDNPFLFFENLSYSEYFLNSISDKQLTSKIFKNIDIFSIIFQKLGKKMDNEFCGKASFIRYRMEFFLDEIEIEYYSVKEL